MLSVLLAASEQADAFLSLLPRLFRSLLAATHFSCTHLSLASRGTLSYGSFSFVTQTSQTFFSFLFSFLILFPPSCTPGTWVFTLENKAVRGAHPPVPAVQTEGTAVPFFAGEGQMPMGYLLIISSFLIKEF